jgi:hypothetical protein
MAPWTTPLPARTTACRLGCNVPIPPQRNCFANDVPLVDCEKRYTVYYVNGHLLAFHGKA